MKNKKISTVLLCLAVVVIGLMVLCIATMGREEKKEQITVGFIMSGGIEETGWNGMHYDGIKQACEDMDAKLLVKEYVEEFSGQCPQAIDELVAEGADLIILSSYGYSEEAMDKINEYPEVAFYGNSSEYHEDNLTSYFVRMYQARYLAGMLAGMKTESGYVGYVAAMANNEVNRGISAFTLGVLRTNPDAKVVVAWTGDWDNETEEIRLANALIHEKNVDVLTYHQNLPNVVKAAEEAGVYSIGYHEAVEECSDYFLTTVACSWNVVYQELIREYMRGNENQVRNYWIGMEADAVILTEYSGDVTGQEAAELEKARNEILAGQDVFSGLIYDTAGNIKCEKGAIIADEILLEQFDWYVKGVEFYEEVE